MRRHLLQSFLLGFAAACLTMRAAAAHPIPKKAHDRTIVVHLTSDAVLVDYRLEVDSWTVVYIDLPAVDDKVDLTKLTRPDEFYEAFARCYAPILADNLVARLDGQLLTFQCEDRSHRLLDHLQCDFRFRAEWKPGAGARHQLSFREGNYEREVGAIKVSLAGTVQTPFLEKSEADEELKARPATQLRPGDEERLRTVAAVFEVRGHGETATIVPARPGQQTAGEGQNFRKRFHDWLDSDEGFWLGMCLAALWGAAHALTPGHGKTLVAAYLVGEQGTVWHALLLGVVVTLTHTGVVIVLAALLPRLFPEAAPADVQTVLGMVSGLLVAGLGFWLLLRRLAGRADHFHLGGHGHHHHHGHSHDEHGHTHPVPSPIRDLGWGRLVVLGMSGGIVPCWDAIVLFGLTVNRPALCLPLLLAFSGGLAGVLVVIGILVVSAKGTTARWGHGGLLPRLFQALPVLSAIMVTGMGLWLCYDSLHAKEETPPAAQTRP